MGRRRLWIAPYLNHIFSYFLAISNMIGKLVTGWFSDISWVDPFSLFNSYILLSGATVCFLPLCTSFEHFAVVMAIYGFFTSFFMLKTIVLVELLGLENLTSAYRWLPFVKSNAIACWITWLNWLDIMIFLKKWQLLKSDLFL